MSIQWAGILSFVLFGIQFLFTVAGLVFLHIALKIICTTYLKRTNSKIFRPLFFLLVYAFVWMLFRQAISLKILTFTFESTELIINLVLGFIQAIVALWLLFKILNDTKSIPVNKGK